MSYCIYTDLVERFGAKELSELTNMMGPCPAIDDAINDATAEIDSYLAVRYSLPIASPVPAVLKRCACELARYFLWDDNITDHIRQRYEDSITILKSIANGTMVLPINGSSIQQPSRSGGVQFSSTPSVWGRPWQ